MNEKGSSRLIGVPEFSSHYAAAAFAAEARLWLCTTVTLLWVQLGAKNAEDAQQLFLGFTKCFRDWCSQRAIRIAFVYVHETGKRVGLHTHVALFLPVEEPFVAKCRQMFLAWLRAWKKRVAGSSRTKAVRVRGISRPSETIHWLNCSYLLKGYDRAALVVSADNSPDGEPVLLGDIIPWTWEDPGQLAMTTRIGCSRSLGPQSRSRGVEHMIWYGDRKLKPFDPAKLDLFGNLALPKADRMVVDRTHYPYWFKPVPFRSKFDDGCRDIRGLYPAEFLELIQGLPVSGAPAQEPDSDRMSRIIERLAADWENDYE